MSTNTTNPDTMPMHRCSFYNRLRLKENEFSFRAQTLPALPLTLTLTVESLRYYIFHTPLLLSFAPQKMINSVYIPRHPREMYTRNTRKKKKCIFPFCFSFCCFLFQNFLCSVALCGSKRTIKDLKFIRFYGI